RDFTGGFGRAARPNPPPHSWRKIMLQNLRPIEIILLIAIVLLLFGAKKLPDAARGIGQSLKIFRKELRSEEDPAPAPKMAEQPVPAQAGGESVPAASATQDAE